MFLVKAELRTFGEVRSHPPHPPWLRHWRGEGGEGERGRGGEMAGGGGREGGEGEGRGEGLGGCDCEWRERE